VLFVLLGSRDWNATYDFLSVVGDGTGDLTLSLLVGDALGVTLLCEKENERRKAVSSRSLLALL